MDKIKIKNKNYNIKYSIRALFVFEEISNKLFELKNTMDFYLFYYSLILANNDTDLTFDKFIDYCDEDERIVGDFNKYLQKHFEKQSQFVKKEDSKKK